MDFALVAECGGVVQAAQEVWIEVQERRRSCSLALAYRKGSRA